MMTLRQLFAILLLCMAMPAGASISYAQIGRNNAVQAADLIAKGEAALEKGQFEVAAQNFGRALRTSDLDEKSVAKTLYQRGVANERAGRPAQAIADITGALFLPDLSTADRAKAYLSRGRAYEAVGLTSQASSDIARARSGGVDERQVARASQPAASSSQSGPAFETVSSSASNRAAAPTFRTSSERAPPPVPSFQTSSQATRAQPKRQQVASFETQARATPPKEEIPSFRTTIVPQDGQAPAAETPEQESSGRVSRFVGNLWSRASGDEKEASSPAPPVAAAAPAAPQWQQKTNVARAPAPAAPSWNAQVKTPSRTAAPAATISNPAPAAGGRGYRIQLAALKTDGEAQQTWKRLQSKHGQLLGGREPNIVKTELGGLGTFYRLQLGPFADKASSQQLCKDFKAGGLDCFLLAP